MTAKRIMDLFLTVWPYDTVRLSKDQIQEIFYKLSEHGLVPELSFGWDNQADEIHQLLHGYAHCGIIEWCNYERTEFRILKRMPKEEKRK